MLSGHFEVERGRPVGPRHASRPSRRVGTSLEPLDLLSHRVRLLVLQVLDLAGLAALFLQMTPPGLPFSMSELGSRVDESATREFWFVPTLVFAILSPLLCGCVLGVLGQVRWALWAYAAASLVCVGFRLFLTFEMSRHERAVATSPLLVDIIVMSICVVVQSSACESAAVMAIYLRHNRLVKSLPPPNARLGSGSCGSLRQTSTSTRRGGREVAEGTRVSSPSSRGGARRLRGGATTSGGGAPRVQLGPFACPHGGSGRVEHA